MKRIILLFIPIFVSAVAAAQVYDAAGKQIDTTGFYSDKTDSLAGAVFTARQNGTYISKFKDVRVETISASGLCKMACCNLAESFENSASVTVGYSDAVTGARQIRLLGQSGIYTQMLDENRPVMRGLSAPFGLSYVPGQWLESIQIAKGAASVVNGVESMTGQINLEHRKPTDEKPLFINASIMNDTKADFNVASSLQLNDSWSTVLLGHVSGNFMGMDGNKDGFLDDPRQLQFNLSNRWLYYSPSGAQLRFGVRAIRDKRDGGEDERVLKKNDMMPSRDLWQSNILNQSIDGYVKLGVPLNDDNSQNIAMVLDYSYQDMNSDFSATTYNAGQHSGWFNLLYMNEVNEMHKFTLGAGTMLDGYNEDYSRKIDSNSLNDQAFNGRSFYATTGLFGEYTLHLEEKFSMVAGLRGEMYNNSAISKPKFTELFHLSPRLTMKYTPVEGLVIRANGGRGLRWSNPLTDNLGVFSTSKLYRGGYDSHILEDSWIFGGNISYYFHLGATDNAYVSFDYFRTQFVEQSIIDYEHYVDAIDFYNLRSIANGRSFTDTYQLDFSCEPVERFTVSLTGRYTNAKLTMADRGLVERPMTSRYKAVLNLQYATNLNKWIFDFTASVSGPSRVYDFMKDNRQIKSRNGGYYSTAYPLLYAQITRRFKGVDLYIGGENLTNFRQKDLINGTVGNTDFDASCIWGPISGIKAYAGVRFTLWKTEK